MLDQLPAFAAALAIVGVAIGVGRWALIRWISPMTRSDGDVLFDLLITCERIFGLATADGGCLRYPWKVDGTVWQEHTLRELLARGASRSGDKALATALGDCQAALRHLFADAYHHRAMVAYEGQPPTPPDPSEIERAKRQVTAAELGASSVEVARARVQVLESRNRWLRSA